MENSVVLPIFPHETHISSICADLACTGDQWQSFASRWSVLLIDSYTNHSTKDSLGHFSGVFLIIISSASFLWTVTIHDFDEFFVSKIILNVDHLRCGVLIIHPHWSSIPTDREQLRALKCALHLHSSAWLLPDCPYPCLEVSSCQRPSVAC